MKKFEIIKSTREITWKDRAEITEGCTLSVDNPDIKILESFDSLEAARAALEKYSTEVRKLSGEAGAYYHITEYAVQENEYDEDGEWCGCGDVWNFSIMPTID